MSKWPMVELGDICQTIRNGLSVKQSQSAGGLPITRIETISNWAINPGRCGYADLGKSDVDGRLMQRGDILLSHINSLEHLGKTASYEGIPELLVHGMNLLLLRADFAKVLPKYLLLSLRTLAFKAQILQAANKSVNQASVSVTNLKRLQIPLPPLPEQKRIAKILDQADALRAKRREAIAKLDTFLQSTFLGMFGDPVTNPKGWEVRAIGESLKVLGGYAFKSQDFSESGLPIIRISNLAGDNVDLVGCARIPEQLAGKGLRFRLEPGDTLIAMSGATTGKIGCVPDHLSETWLLNQRVGAFRIPSGSGIARDYLRALLRSSFYQAHVWNLAGGAAQPNISGKQLESARIPVPPIQLQQQFADIVTKVEIQKQQMRDHLTQLDTLFASLQSRAFNGEL